MPIHREVVRIYPGYDQYAFVCSDPCSFQLDSLANIGSEKQVGTLSLALGMATDVVIAGALCWFLRGLRTGHRK